MDHSSVIRAAGCLVWQDVFRGCWMNYCISGKSIRGSKKLPPGSSPLQWDGKLSPSEWSPAPSRSPLGKPSSCRSHRPVCRTASLPASADKGKQQQPQGLALELQEPQVKWGCSGHKATRAYLGDHINQGTNTKSYCGNQMNTYSKLLPPSKQ